MAEQTQTKLSMRITAALLALVLVVGFAPSFALVGTAYADDEVQVETQGIELNLDTAKAAETAKAYYDTLRAKLANVDKAELVNTAKATYESLSAKAKAFVASELPVYAGMATDTWEQLVAATEGKSAAEVADMVLDVICEKTGIDKADLIAAAQASYENLSAKAKEIIPAEYAQYLSPEGIALAADAAKVLYYDLCAKAGVDGDELIATAKASYESLSAKAKAFVANELPVYAGMATDTWEQLVAATEGKSAAEVADMVIATICTKAGIDKAELVNSAKAAYASLSAKAKEAIPAEIGQYLNDATAKASANWEAIKAQIEGKSAAEVAKALVAALSAKTGIDKATIEKYLEEAYAKVGTDYASAIDRLKAAVEQVKKMIEEALGKAVKDGDTYEIDGSTYTVLSAEKCTVALTVAKDAKKVVVPKAVQLKDGKSYKVKKIAKGAFKNSKAKKIVIKTKALAKAKAVKGSLTGSKVKTAKVPAKKLDAYQKVLTKKIAGKNVKVK